ncbi:MAG TPA: hypothetical protein VD770_01265, partial [Coxiellaceae bacterium]|nr:hypothetical protein [Coxiellaceae bacterium]
AVRTDLKLAEATLADLDLRSLEASEAMGMSSVAAEAAFKTAEPHVPSFTAEDWLATLKKLRDELIRLKAAITNSSQLHEEELPSAAAPTFSPATRAPRRSSVVISRASLLAGDATGTVGERVIEGKDTSPWYGYIRKLIQKQTVDSKVNVDAVKEALHKSSTDETSLNRRFATYLAENAIAEVQKGAAAIQWHLENFYNKNRGTRADLRIAYGNLLDLTPNPLGADELFTLQREEIQDIEEQLNYLMDTIGGFDRAHQLLKGDLKKLSLNLEPQGGSLGARLRLYEFLLDFITNTNVGMAQLSEHTTMIRNTLEMLVAYTGERFKHLQHLLLQLRAQFAAKAASLAPLETLFKELHKNIKLQLERLDDNDRCLASGITHLTEQFNSVIDSQIMNLRAAINLVHANQNGLLPVVGEILQHLVNHDAQLMALAQQPSREMAAEAAFDPADYDEWLSSLAVALRYEFDEGADKTKASIKQRVRVVRSILENKHIQANEADLRTLLVALFYFWTVPAGDQEWQVVDTHADLADHSESLAKEQQRFIEARLNDVAMLRAMSPEESAFILASLLQADETHQQLATAIIGYQGFKPKERAVMLANLVKLGVYEKSLRGLFYNLMAGVKRKFKLNETAALVKILSMVKAELQIYLVRILVINPHAILNDLKLAQAAIWDKGFDALRPELFVALFQATKLEAKKNSLGTELALERHRAECCVEVAERLLFPIDEEGFDLARASYFLSYLRNKFSPQNTPLIYTQHLVQKLAQEFIGAPLKIDTAIAGLRFVPIAGDGHCLFSAIGRQLGVDQAQLRRDVVAFLKANVDTPLDDVGTKFGDLIDAKNSFGRNRYFDAMEKNAWGSAVEMDAISLMRGRPIIVIGPHGELCNILPEVLNEVPIFIRYNGYNHYDAFDLLPGQDLEVLIEQLKTRSTNRPSIERVNKARELIVHLMSLMIPNESKRILTEILTLSNRLTTARLDLLVAWVDGTFNNLKTVPLPLPSLLSLHGKETAFALNQHFYSVISQKNNTELQALLMAMPGTNNLLQTLFVSIHERSKSDIFVRLAMISSLFLNPTESEQSEDFDYWFKELLNYLIESWTSKKYTGLVHYIFLLGSRELVDLWKKVLSSKNLSADLRVALSAAIVYAHYRLAYSANLTEVQKNQCAQQLREFLISAGLPESSARNASTLTEYLNARFNDGLNYCGLRNEANDLKKAILYGMAMPLVAPTVANLNPMAVANKTAPKAAETTAQRVNLLTARRRETRNPLKPSRDRFSSMDSLGNEEPLLMPGTIQQISPLKQVRFSLTPTTEETSKATETTPIRRTPGNGYGTAAQITNDDHIVISITDTAEENTQPATETTVWNAIKQGAASLAAGVVAALSSSEQKSPSSPSQKINNPLRAAAKTPYQAGLMSPTDAVPNPLRGAAIAALDRAEPMSPTTAVNNPLRAAKTPYPAELKSPTDALHNPLKAVTKRAQSTFMSSPIEIDPVTAANPLAAVPQKTRSADDARSTTENISGGVTVVDNQLNTVTSESFTTLVPNLL